MMKRVLPALLLVGLLTTLETLANRWLASSGPFFLILPLLTGAAFLLPHGQLARLTFLGAIAGELESRLPAGTVFTVTLAVPHLVVLVLRHPRPELPWFVRGIVGALVMFALLLLAAFASRVSSFPPSRLFPSFLTMHLLVPSVIAGLVTGATVPILKRARLRPVLERIGVQIP